MEGKQADSEQEDTAKKIIDYCHEVVKPMKELWLEGKCQYICGYKQTPKTLCLVFGNSCYNNLASLRYCQWDGPVTL
jgi:hypothetical protein